MGLSRARTFANSFAGFSERRVSLDEAQRRFKLVSRSAVNLSAVRTVKAEVKLAEQLKAQIG
jgi:hypothetical protein